MTSLSFQGQISKNATFMVLGLYLFFFLVAIKGLESIKFHCLSSSSC